MNRQELHRQIKDTFLFDDNEIYAEAQRRIKECREKKGKKLDFSGLGLKDLPPEIAELVTLTELDISNHTLKMIPSFIGNLVNLKKLTLGYGIPEIPGWVWGLENLNALSIDNDTIETVPAEIAGLKKLRKLHLYGAMITRLPGEIGEHLPLTAIDLVCPQLGALPESFANLKTMQSFRFTESYLATVPDYICGWTNLKELVISTGGIPKNIGNLQKLRYLDLHGSGITKIPDSLGNCPLEHLELSGNFKTVPGSFGNLVNLKTLKLFSGKPMTLPDTFGNLSALEELEIRAPALNVPSSFGRLSALEHLSLVTKDIELPKTFSGLSALKEIWIFAPNMPAVPNSIGSCKNLKRLSLESDKISALPESFCNLEKLEELHLRTFALKSLPGRFGNLASLKSIDIFSGALTTLPESMGSLKKLRSFWLDAYNIKKPPEWFNKLSYIKDKSIKIGKEENVFMRRRDINKKRGVINFRDLNDMSSNYRWKLLESYSLKEIESVICSATEYSFYSEVEKDVFSDIMLVRRRKLNKKFKWTLENKKRIAKVSDEFLKAWEAGFEKAKTFITALHGDDDRVEIILHPEIVNFKEDGTCTEERLYYIITGFFHAKEELSIRIGSDPEKIEGNFRQDIRIKRDLSWNIEGLGDIELEDYHIGYALHILYDHNVWALEDIAKINSISMEIRVHYDGGKI